MAFTRKNTRRRTGGCAFISFSIILIVSVTAASTAQVSFDIDVDFTESEQMVNRRVFSLVNHQRLYAEGTETANDVFRYLNPSGTVSRIETMIHLMEPVNDNSDPQHFNWEGYDEERMFRFINDRERRYIADVHALAMEPLILLTYNAPWLTDVPGDLNRPPTEPEEWAEFAAAVVESINGDPDSDDWQLNVRYLEVWNEPSENGLYWHGTREEYVELFRVVADRIHRDYPGVLVGGPAVLGSEGPFLMEFVETCGDIADFFTMHLYNELPNLTVRKAADWLRYIRSETGRPDVPLMITEGDQWYMIGAEKREYLLVRQFELLEQDDALHSFHHFSLPYYQQTADWRFGLVHLDGSVVDKNYWPFWFFRHHQGERVSVSVDTDTRRENDRRGTDERGVRRKYPRVLYADASHDADDGSQVLLYYNPENDDASAVVSITLTVDPAPHDRLLILERVDGYRHGVETVDLLPAGTDRCEWELDVPPRTGWSLRVVDSGEDWTMDTVIADVTVPRSASRPANVDCTITAFDASLEGRLFLETLDASVRIPFATVEVPALSARRIEADVDIAEIRNANAPALRVVFETASGERIAAPAERIE